MDRSTNLDIVELKVRDAPRGVPFPLFRRLVPAPLQSLGAPRAAGGHSGCSGRPPGPRTRAASGSGVAPRPPPRAASGGSAPSCGQWPRRPGCRPRERPSPGPGRPATRQSCPSDAAALPPRRPRGPGSLLALRAWGQRRRGHSRSRPRADADPGSVSPARALPRARTRGRRGNRAREGTGGVPAAPRADEAGRRGAGAEGRRRPGSASRPLRAVLSHPRGPALPPSPFPLLGPAAVRSLQAALCPSLPVGTAACSACLREQKKIKTLPNHQTTKSFKCPAHCK